MQKTHLDENFLVNGSEKSVILIKPKEINKLLFEQALQHYNQKEYSEASKLALRIVNQEPKNETYIRLCAHCLHMENRLPEAKNIMSY